MPVSGYFCMDHYSTAVAALEAPTLVCVKDPGLRLG